MSLQIPRPFLLCVLLCVVSATAEDWPRFRGPHGNGVSSAKAAPIRMTPENTVWKTALPGTGWSSPVYTAGRVWITTAETTAASPAELARKKQGAQFADMKTAAGSVTLRAVCVDVESGKILHNVSLKKVEDPELIHPLNSYASPTAAISKQRVVCHFGSYGTWCLDAESGEVVWEQDTLVVDHSVGPGSSPVIVDDVVIVVYDGIDRQFVAGLSLATGKEVWNTPRPKMRASNGEYRKAYSTPLLITVDGQTQAVIPGSQWMCAYDPASGREIWRADCGDGFSTTPMAVYDSGLVICSTGFMSPQLVAVNPKGSGDITKSNIVWRARRGGSTMPTAVGRDGLLYSMGDKGVLSILDSKTGELRNRVRVSGNFSSSPLLAAGRLYVGNKEGVMSVFSLKQLNSEKSPQALARNKLDGDIMASPAVIGSDMLIRTSKSLLRVRPE